MADLDQHYIRVTDFAKRYGFTESAVYKKIHRGEIPAIRIGKAYRIPSSELERYLNPVRSLEQRGAPEDDQPIGLRERVARFEELTGRKPREFIDAWRAGEIPDDAENAQRAIEALALRAAMDQPVGTA